MKGLKMIKNTDKNTEALSALCRLIGRAEAFNAMETFGRAARIQQLKIIQESGVYKSIPGCSTMRDVFDQIGVAKTTGYRELQAFDKLGGDIMLLLDEMGISDNEMFLLASGMVDEELKFEVLDEGQVRIDGKKLSVRDNPEMVSGAIRRALIQIKLQKQAKKGLEASIEEEKAESKRLREKIKAGEAQLRELLEKSGKESVNMAHPAFLGLTQIIGIIQQIQESEIDLLTNEEVDRAIAVIGNAITKPLLEIFHPFWRPKKENYGIDQDLPEEVEQEAGR